MSVLTTFFVLFVFQVLENHDTESQTIKRSLYQEQQRLRKHLSSLLNSFTNGSTVVMYKSLTSTSSSSCDEEIDVENDDETGYGSADDSLSVSSGSSLSSVL